MKNYRTSMERYLSISSKTAATSNPTSKKVSQIYIDTNTKYMCKVIRWNLCRLDTGWHQIFVIVTVVLEMRKISMLYRDHHNMILKRKNQHNIEKINACFT